MLAGRVKLKQFAVAAVVLALAGCAGVGVLLRDGLAERAADRAAAEERAAAEAEAEERAAAAAALQAEAAAAAAAAAAPPLLPADGAAAAATAKGADASPAAAASARAHDSDVLAYVGRDIGTDKLKDVSRGKTWKINVYQDSGSASANRAKVDLDRDDKWDEKWTFNSDGVEVQIDPNDSESYSVVRTWDGSSWSTR